MTPAAKPGAGDGRSVADAALARVARMARARRAMGERGVEVLLCSLGADLPWLTGYEAMPLERPTVLVLPADDTATLVVPGLEAPRVREDPTLFELRPWSDGEDAVEIVAGLVGRRTRLAVSDRSWAALLLGLQAARPSATWCTTSSVLGGLRAVKDAAEIAVLTAAAEAADRVAAALLAGEVPLLGRSETEVAADLSARLVAEGHARVDFAIVASGPNAASPHHEPTSRRIDPGEAVVCDFGGTFRIGDEPGYCSDTTRTVVTGEPPAGLAELYSVLQAAQAAAVAAVAPGIACEEIDLTARRIIVEAGHGEHFIHRTGHGIGMEVHEDPYIVEGNSTPVEAGHAFSVEPGIYLPGRFGARIEDIVVATSDGVLPLNRTDHSLHAVEA